MINKIFINDRIRIIDENIDTKDVCIFVCIGWRRRGWYLTVRKVVAGRRERECVCIDFHVSNK